MNNSDFGRLARCLSVAAAFLAGCGAPQAPLVAPGAMPDQTRMRSTSTATAAAQRLQPALQNLGYKVTASLLYVTNYTVTYNNVSVYRARGKDPTPLATISDGIDTPSGACIDGEGTLYVTNQPPSGPGWISEYPLGKTAPSKVVKNGVNTPAFCAIDAKGNLWVTDIGLDDVAEYLKGATKPHAVITSGLTFPVGIAVDHSGYHRKQTGLSDVASDAVSYPLAASLVAINEELPLPQDLRCVSHHLIDDSQRKRCGTLPCLVAFLAIGRRHRS